MDSLGHNAWVQSLRSSLSEVWVLGYRPGKNRGEQTRTGKIRRTRRYRLHVSSNELGVREKWIEGGILKGVQALNHQFMITRATEIPGGKESEGFQKSNSIVHHKSKSAQLQYGSPGSFVLTCLRSRDQILFSADFCPHARSSSSLSVARL